MAEIADEKGTEDSARLAMSFTRSVDQDDPRDDSVTRAVEAVTGQSANRETTIQNDLNLDLTGLSSSEAAFAILASTKGKSSQQASQIITVFNLWKADHSEEALDLSNRSLAGVNLTGADLSNVNLKNAELTGSTLDRANLDKTNLSGAVCDGTSFRATHFYPTTSIQCAYFNNCDWQDANFSNFPITEEQSSTLGAWFVRAVLRQPRNLAQDVAQLYVSAQGLVSDSEEQSSDPPYLSVFIEEDFDSTYFFLRVALQAEKGSLAITPDDIALRFLHLTKKGDPIKRAKALCQFGKWREKYGNNEQLDLRGKPLDSVNLQSTKLANIDFSDSDLRRARLDFANLRDATLNRALLKGSILRGAKMNPTGVMQTLFEGCDFKDIDYGGEENLEAFADALSHAVIIRPRNLSLSLAAAIKKAQGLVSVSAA